MYQMKLTNKQIQDILVDMRKQLKNFKSAGGKMQLNYDLPKIDTEAAKIIIEPLAWKKMQALIQECDKEIAWHGIVEKNAIGNYTIKDIVVFPQTVTGSTVNSDETKYSFWLMEQPDFDHIRCHGHSHVNMGTSPSGVDTRYQEDILRNLRDFYIFMIWNKKGDNWCAIYDVEGNIAYNDNDIEIVTPETEATEWARGMIKEYVTTPAAPKTKPTKKEKKSAVDDDFGGYDYYGNDYFRRFYGQV